MMNRENKPTYRYQVGGSLPVDAPSYVFRKADAELYEKLLEGKFCYVLNSRQMGKSSLCLRTMQRLQQENMSCVVIDLTGICSQDITPNGFYKGLIDRLVDGFHFYHKFNLKKWWREQEDLSTVQRFSLFVEKVLLVEVVSEKLFIFIDEIDNVISLNFKLDDFFALIRFFYNQRAINPQYERLTFALFGVATPSDLIQDKTKTPFNIGSAIELRGFEEQEAQPLAKGLEVKADNPQIVLREILQWTGGQPFLTQKLCQLVVTSDFSIPAGSESEIIETLVKSQVIENWESQDDQNHFGTIRDRILSNEHRASRLLGLYQQILQQGELAADDSSEQMYLRLSGLVVKQNGKLKVYNRIYQNVFDQNWVNQELANLRPYSEAINAWLASNRQDESRLLRGKALQEASNWANERSLSNEDYQFLAASEQLEKRELQRQLEAEREANQILEKAREEAKEGTRIARDGIRALQLFETGGREIEALILAMQAGQELKGWVKDGRPLDEYPATNPLFTLQQILDQIRERNQFTAHESCRVTDITFSPDGQYIATASDDCTAFLWDLYGNQLVEFKGHEFAVNSISFSPNGKYVATCSENHIRVWDLCGKRICEFTGLGVDRIKFSSNGKYIATASDSDDGFSLWDLCGNQIAQFSRYDLLISNICFSQDGQYKATISDDSHVRLWDSSENQLAEFSEHDLETTSVSISPDGKYIATGSYKASDDITAYLWDLSGNLIVEFTEHEDTVNSVSFSPDGNQIASASNDGTVKLWDLSGTQLSELKRWREEALSLSFSPDGKFLVTGYDDGTVTLWDLFGNPPILLQHENIVNNVSFNPNGLCIVTTSYDGRARLWDLSGNQIANFTVYQQIFTSLTFSPDEHHIVTGSSDGKVRLWNLSGNQIAQFSGNDDASWVISVSFSPDGRYIATGSSGGTAYLWDSSGNQLAEFIRHEDIVTSISFSPNGEYIATGSEDGTTKLWDLSGNQIREFAGNDVCFSPNGEYIATASEDCTAKLWYLSGNQKVEFTGHKDWISSVKFSPDGQRLATASNDGTLKLWDLSGNQIAEFKAHKEGINSLSFSPDGKYLATASDDGTVRLWRVETLDELLARGCEWLKYYFASHPEALQQLKVCQKK
ncbi:MAG: AAA-like domain-containing protein [Phormidium sp.]